MHSEYRYHPIGKTIKQVYAVSCGDGSITGPFEVLCVYASAFNDLPPTDGQIFVAYVNGAFVSCHPLGWQFNGYAEKDILGNGVILAVSLDQAHRISDMLLEQKKQKNRQ